MNTHDYLCIVENRTLLFISHTLYNSFNTMEYLAVSPSMTGPYITPLPYIATRSPAGLRVAYRQKNGTIEPSGDAERFIAPWVPVDRVVCVLK